MPSCCAVDCAYDHYKSKTVGKSVHRFPFSQPEVLQKWVLNVCRKDWWPKRNTVLCNSHFEEACFDRTGQTTRLRKDAVPTIFSHKPLIKYESDTNIYSGICEYKVSNPPPVIVQLPTIKQETIEDIESESNEDAELSFGHIDRDHEDTELSSGDIDLRDHNYGLTPLKLKTKYEEEKEKNDHLKAKFKMMQQNSMQLQKRASMLLNLLRDLKST